MAKMAKNSTKNVPLATASTSTVFTKDKVPIHRLHLENIPECKTEKSIRRYFSTFGLVKSVMIIKNNPFHNTRGYTNGFVTFENTESAEEALNKSNHRGISTRLVVTATKKQPVVKAAINEPVVKAAKNQPVVKAAKNEPIIKAAKNQPHIINKPAYTKKMECDKGDGAQKGLAILDLNDDCLLHLFSYLTSYERFKMSLACRRFQNLNERLIKLNYVFDFSDMMKTFTLKETEQIVSLFRNNIKRIYIYGGSSLHIQHLSFVCKYCQNLDELNLSFFRDISLETFSQIFKSSKNMKGLTLQECYLDKKICSLIGKQSNLERLDLSYSSSIDGKDLVRLKNLTELRLKQCENIETREFINIFKANKLKTLDIQDCCLLCDIAFDNLIRTQKDLEEIVISNSYHAVHNIAIVSQLPNLKHIQIHYVKSRGLETDILLKLLQNRKDQLESLEIYNFLLPREHINRNRISEFRNLKKLCLVADKYLDDGFLIEIANNCKQLVEIVIAGSRSVTAEAIKAIVSTLKQLKRLDISSCFQFQDALYHELIEYMIERNAMPLTLCVGDTKIKPSILLTKKYKKNERLLTLSFEENIEFFDDSSDISDSSSDADFGDARLFEADFGHLMLW